MISSKELGDRLAHARKLRELTQAEVATKVGIARTTLVAIEKGERRPSDNELVTLSSTLGVQLHDLLRMHVVLSSASPRFRSQPGVEEAVLKGAVEQLKNLGSKYVELEQMLDIKRIPAPLESVQSYQVSKEEQRLPPKLIGEDAAQVVRKSLGLGDGPALSIDQQLELAAGFRLFYLELPSPIAALFIWSHELGACVAVNRKHPYERQRWSIVHELGHYLRDREAGEVLPVQVHRRDNSEIFADAFTAEFLLPARGVTQLFAQHLRANGKFTVATLLEMAKYYEVSFQAMTLRLEELERLPKGRYDELIGRGFKPQEAAEKLGLEKKIPVNQGLPHRYITLALQAYEQELLSESELSDYLLCDRISARDIYISHRKQYLESGDEIELDLSSDVFRSSNELSKQ